MRIGVSRKRGAPHVIAYGRHAAVGLRRRDVFINPIEVKQGNWSFGNGEAQYAV